MSKIKLSSAETGKSDETWHMSYTGSTCMFTADINPTEQSPSSEALSVKKCTVCSGIQRFITVYTKAHHCSWSSDKCIQSTTCHSTSVSLILILSFHLYPAFSFRLTDQTCACISNLSHVCHVYYPSHFPWHVHRKVIWWKAQTMVFLSTQQNCQLGAICVLTCYGR